MHPSTLAARRQLAGDRIDAAISQLAEHAGVAVPAQDPVRDRDARDLFRLEALADAIESIAASLLPETSGTPSPSSQGTPSGDAEASAAESSGVLWTPGDAIGRLTVKQIEDEVADIDDIEGLEGVLAAERAGKNRAGAIAAIEGRIAKLRGG